jgi:hypothetical protein
MKPSESFVSNVACSDEEFVTDNFYFENGKFTKDGKFSERGTLYIFDRMEGLPTNL